MAARRKRLECIARLPNIGGGPWRPRTWRRVPSLNQLNAARSLIFATTGTQSNDTPDARTASHSRGKLIEDGGHARASEQSPRQADGAASREHGAYDRTSWLGDGAGKYGRK